MFLVAKVKGISNLIELKSVHSMILDPVHHPIPATGYVVVSAGLKDTPYSQEKLLVLDRIPRSIEDRVYPQGVYCGHRKPDYEALIRDFGQTKGLLSRVGEKKPDHSLCKYPEENKWPYDAYGHKSVVEFFLLLKLSLDQYS
jgi:hypothetical protein